MRGVPLNRRRWQGQSRRFPTKAEARELFRLRDAQADNWRGRTVNSPNWWARREFCDYVRDLYESGCTLVRIGEVLGLTPKSIHNAIAIADRLDEERGR